MLLIKLILEFFTLRHSNLVNCCYKLTLKAVLPDFCKFQKRLNKKGQVVGQDDDLEAAVVTRLDQVSNSGDEGQAGQSLDDGGLGHSQFEHLIKKDDLKGQQRCAVIGNQGVWGPWNLF